MAERVSPASRSEIALHVVQAASYLEAAQMLSRRGFACDVSSLVRITTATAEASTRLRDAALEAVCVCPLLPMARLPASGSASASMVDACARGARTAVVRRPRDAMALQPHGVSHGCW